MKTPRVQQIRDEFRRMYEAGEFVEDKSGTKVLEIIGASFIADERFIFRPPNEDYIEQEFRWYLSESLKVKDLKQKEGEIVPKIWKDVADRDGRINSNYGYLVFSEDNYTQFTHALQQLLDHIETRRSIMIYTRPTMQMEYNMNGMQDFICTNTVQFLVRDHKLHMIVNMRSNDLVFGYNNDYAWQKWCQDEMVDALLDNGHHGLSAGDITWQVGSAHLYERHFKDLYDSDEEHESALADVVLRKEKPPFTPELPGEVETKTPGSVKALRECIDLQLKKAHDYQNPNSTVRQADYYQHGLITLMDIVHAKMLRAKSVIETIQHDPDETPNFESLEDSFKDAINYLSFAVAYTRGEIDGQDSAHSVIDNTPIK